MPIHLIWGDDIGSIDRNIKSFIEEAVNPNWISINLSRFNGQNPSEAHQALEEVRSPPFGSGSRVVIVNRSPFCNSCSTDLSKHFENALDLIPDNTHLIIRIPTNQMVV